MCKDCAGAEEADKMGLLSVPMVLALHRGTDHVWGGHWVDQMPLGALLPFLHVHPSASVCFASNSQPALRQPSEVCPGLPELV